VFIGWAISLLLQRRESEEDEEDSSSSSCGYRIAKTVFQVALPHVMTVMCTYFYYVGANPAKEFIDTDACHQMVRAFLIKDVTNTPTAIHVYLVLNVLSDFTVHYFSAPFLLYLYGTGQLSYVVTIPWSTIFVFLLSAIMAPVQIHGAVIYCGGLSFSMISSVMINFAFHVLFYLSRRGTLGFGPCGLILLQPEPSEEEDHDEVEEEEEDVIQKMEPPAVDDKAEPPTKMVGAEGGEDHEQTTNSAVVYY
jgi:hypothetical protein